MALGWVGLIAGGTACAGVARPVERPRVEIRRVELVSTAEQGYQLVLEVSAVNPNETSLRGVGADWELYVGEVVRARGRTEGRLELPARGTVAAPLVGRIAPGAAESIHATVAHEPATIRVEGVIHWYSDAGDVTTPFAWDEAERCENALAGAIRRPACAGR